jgi:adenylate kinase
MDTIQLHDLKFKPFLSEEELAKIVKTLVYQVSHDLDEGEIPIFIGILNGSFLFAADFIRQFQRPCEVSFVKLHSYQGTQSTETVNELVGINEDITNRTVVILEDIVDTGNTLYKIYDIFKDKNVKQLKIATLFFKPTVYRKELPIDYIGKSIEDKFIVGYGLDYNGLGRNLPSIYQLKTEA